MKLRQGRKVKRTLYTQTGDQPSDHDQLIGVVDTPELAWLICRAVNDYQRRLNLQPPDHRGDTI